MNSFLHFLMNFWLIWSLRLIYSMNVLNLGRYKNKHFFDKLKNLLQLRLLRHHLTQLFQSFSTVVFFLVGKDCVLLQMFKRGNLDVISFNHRISTTKKQELCTACRALHGFVNSFTKYEHNNISFDLSINVLNDHKPIFSCSADKDNISPKNKLCTEANDQI